MLAGVPNGILFKSASTRGGTIQDINIHDVDMHRRRHGFQRAIQLEPQLQLRQNSRTAIKEYPAYWKVLTEAVPPEKGFAAFAQRAHLRHPREGRSRRLSA